MNTPFFDLDTPRLRVRCFGSRNPIRATAVDVHTRGDGRCFYVGRLGPVPHSSGRVWHYPEPSGGESNIDASLLTWLRGALAECVETAPLASSVPT